MPLTNLSDEAIKQYENALMARVPAADAVGNTALRRLLSSADQSWTKDRCFAIRNRLIERGQLDSSRGKGGSIRRTRATVLVEPYSAPIADSRQSERDLYEPMYKVIKADWRLDNGLDPARWILRLKTDDVRMAMDSTRRHIG